MAQDLKFHEHLPSLAAEAFEIAGRLCGPCRNFHSLWPYLRIAEASGGNVRAPDVVSAIAQAASADRCRILVAGAADTGLLSVVARTTISRLAEIVVLDRCDTPLELCRRFSRRWSLPIATWHTDLQELAASREFDVVFAHSILQFIAADRRQDVLSRLCRSLRADGRLIMMFRTGNRVEDDFFPEYAAGYAIKLVEQLERKDIMLPEAREPFLRRLELYAIERRAREGELRNREEVEDLISDAGFAIESVTLTDPRIATPFQNITMKLSKQRFLVVARPR